MKKIASLSVVLLFLYGCSQVVASKATHSFTENSKVTIVNDHGDSYPIIEQGNSTAFEYIYTSAQDENVSDDGYTEIIVFDIDPSLTSFSYEGDLLQDIHAHFYRGCFCPNTGSVPVSEGFIRGEKLNDQEWQISMDITFSFGNERQTRTVNAVFTTE
jgi:hypothetical protein